MATVPYQPYPSVESTGPLGGPMSARATPNDFGAQVSEETKKAGNVAFDIAQKEQGLVNETEMMNAETALTQKLGALHGDYMSLSGLEAKDALPGYLAKAQQTANEIGGTVRGKEAAHGYNMLAQRRLGYLTSDWNGYAAGQVRKANQDAHLTSINASQMMAGDPSIASDDYRFGEQVIGPIKHSASGMMDEAHPGFKTSEDGTVNFADTPEGKNLKSEFDKNLNNYLGQAYMKRYDTLSNSYGPIPAYDKFQQEKDKIPPEARVGIESALQPRVTIAHADTVVNTTMGEANQAHKEVLLNPMDTADAIHKFGEGGKVNSETSIDGAVGGWQVMPATFKQYAKDGEDINNAADNERVGRRIVKDLETKFPNDPARVAVGYFSGAGNVSPPGSATPWINDAKDGNGKSVSSYVSDVTKGMGSGKSYATNPNGSPLTEADYYQTHREEIISKGEAYADKVMPGNLEFKNSVRARLTQQMNSAISDQSGRYSLINKSIMRAYNGDLTKGQQPKTWEELNAIPGVKEAINESSVHTPEFIRTLDARIASRSSGDKDTKDYGAKFSELYSQIRPSDPAKPRLTDPSVLYKAFENGEINSFGVDKLQNIMTGKASLQPHEEEIRKQALTFAKGQITGSDESMGIKDHKGNQLYLKYMIAADELAEKMKSEGKTTAEIYDPEGPMGTLVNSFKRPMAQWTADIAHDTDPNNAPAGRTLADITREARSTNDPAKKEALKQEAIKLGFIRADVSAPKPEGTD